MNKTINFMKKHGFYDEPCCGDFLSVCKFCHQKAWLIDDIKHDSGCEIMGVFKEIQQTIEANNERKTLANDEGSCVRNKAIGQNRGKRVSGTTNKTRNCRKR